MTLQVAEWTDEKGFTPVAAKYVRLRPFSEIERNRTYIVTTIVVRLLFYLVYFQLISINCPNNCSTKYFHTPCTLSECIFCMVEKMFLIKIYKSF